MHGDGPATVRTVTEAGRDIETREDCEQLVRAFYARALSDPVVGFIFTDVARLDLEAHVSVIASFWATILLGARSYGGGAFAAHAALDAKVRLRPATSPAGWRSGARASTRSSAARGPRRPRPTPSAWPAPSRTGCAAG